MIAKNVNLPVIICVEENLLLKTPKLMSSRGLILNNPLIVTGRGKTKLIGDQLKNALNPITAPMTVKDASLTEMERIRKKIIDRNIDCLIAIGGGKAIDAGKCAAFSCGINFIAIPTAVSNDGIASPVAVIENCGRTESRMTAIPTAMIADLSVIEKAPAATTRSGVGDLISNLSASLDWKLASIKNSEPFDAFTASMAKSAAEKILESKSQSLTNHDFLRSLIEGLVMSGMAMTIHGSSRPSSGSEHMISHALDALYGSPGSHGEQCGISTLFTMKLHKKPIDTIRELFKKLNMKERPSDLGITKREFLRAVSKGPSMRPGRYSILNETDLKAKERAYDSAFEQ
ncbi:MAG: iron-containing alcohol dehydrogenase family protein [Fibrobacteres bacterium]|nr:iron-containing alcohol dehydrogenase family protein [Fibrobacterota bacterium]